MQKDIQEITKEVEEKSRYVRRLKEEIEKMGVTPE